MHLTCTPGIPASQSLSSISKAARLAEGKKGGVIRVAYLTAVVPKEGSNLVTTIAGGAPTMGVSEVKLFPDSILPHKYCAS